LRVLTEFVENRLVESCGFPPIARKKAMDGAPKEVFYKRAPPEALMVCPLTQ
jgi:hypothetical protein